MRSIVFLVVLVLATGPVLATDAKHEEGREGVAQAGGVREAVVRMVACLRHEGFPTEKEVLHDGQVTNWVLTDRSDDCCRFKTSFRAFASRTEMERTMMGVNAGSIRHDRSNIAMLAPWATRLRPDCEATCETSFEDELISAFRECGDRGAAEQEAR